VLDCIDTGWVSSVGQYVDRFERMLCDYTGASHAIAVANGTAALHVCLVLAGVERDVVVASHGAVSRVVRGLVLGLDGPTVTTLEIPQDKVLVLQAAQMRWE